MHFGRRKKELAKACAERLQHRSGVVHWLVVHHRAGAIVILESRVGAHYLALLFGKLCGDCFITLAQSHQSTKNVRRSRVENRVNVWRGR